MNFKIKSILTILLIILGLNLFLCDDYDLTVEGK